MDVRDHYISFGMDPEFLFDQGEPEHYVRASRPSSEDISNLFNTISENI